MAHNPSSADFSACPLVQDDDVDETAAPSPASRLAPTRGAFITAVLFSVGLAVATMCFAPLVLKGTSSASTMTGIVGFAAEEAAEAEADADKGDEGEADETPSCAADGESCLESKCCVPGGMDGLQCYKKSDDWAQCVASCEPGVHEPEKEGHYDETGTFVKAEWSCEKVGEKSKPGCEAFTNKSKSECPTDYCTSKGKACVPKCDTFATSEEGCWNSKHCMWQDGACMGACWEHDSLKACQPGNKCVWSGEQCQMGWWLFNSHDSCPQDLGYMWNGSCVQDPCSALGEDCSKKGCCSTERGASGMTCFKKDKTWATCQETCSEEDGWACDALGKRANYSSGCAWAGQDCAVDKLCCNRGFVCAVKDQDFTGCVLTVKTSTWIAQKVPIPDGWEGTVLGAGRDEYQMAQAQDDEPKIGNTLYCFMAFLPDSYEVGLVDTARNNKASIFACDEHDLFHTWQSASAGWDTGESTLQNTDVFINVWQQVGSKGSYMKYDWTVKVDPDCVFAPDRLKGHIDSYNLPAWAPVYVKNNGMDPGLGNNGFLGAIEIFTKKAVMIYLDNDAGCLQAMGTDAGEDGFMKGCMDALGVGYVLDIDIFFPDFAAGACANGQRVAFHPLKEPDEYQQCLDILAGKSQW